MPQKTTRTILVVDDEAEIRTALASYLGSEGFQVETAANGSEMAAVLEATQVDLLLLDLGLKHESGLDLLKSKIVGTGIAIVILTGKSDPIERVVGLELGADDYIVKPFLQRELLARINAVLRRTIAQTQQAPAAAPEDKPRQLRINGWSLDLNLRQAETVDGLRIDLTGTEFDMLAALAGNIGVAMSRDQLSMAVLNRAWAPHDRSVDIHIYNLRRKLARYCGDSETIVTVRNHGYVLAGEAG